eukprot:TRINITY_DN4558_c0_g1_i2.p1 TRINITY_DN4558_c0_g1~~TRINITY_DN4558_c0_g1_i2.p1  ORF type:complete len:504 (-),score=100.24 TRINITY_DN4558_c0_g1_i2:5-1516(-)
MIRRPPRSTLSSSSAASDVYKRQIPLPSPKVLSQSPSIFAKKLNLSQDGSRNSLQSSPQQQAQLLQLQQPQQQQQQNVDGLIRRRSQARRDSDAGMLMWQKQMDEQCHEIQKSIINRFYSVGTKDQGCQKNKQVFCDMINQMASVLDTAQIRILRELYENNNQKLCQIVQQYIENAAPNKIQSELLCLINTADDQYFEESSPLTKQKMNKLNNFQSVIQELYQEHLITKKQLKYFYYLYIEEEIVLLSFFEVFLATNDKSDFLENMNLLYKINFFKIKLDYEEIEQFNEIVEKQLGLLYAYNQYLSNHQKSILEKIILKGDISFLKIYEDFKKTKEKAVFIKNISKLADDKEIDIKNQERVNAQQKHIIDYREARLSLFDTFVDSKFLKDIQYVDLVYELIKDNDNKAESVYIIYEVTKNKQDYIENMTLLYEYAYLQNLVKIIKKNSKLWNEKQESFLIASIKQKDSNLLSAYELFMMQGAKEDDQIELFDTVNRFLKLKCN